MSEFMVTISVTRPPHISDDEWAALGEREAEKGREYRRRGVITRIWRIPGTRGNVGIWSAEDATELHARLSDLPLFGFMTITVSPLARHYLES